MTGWGLPADDELRAAESGVLAAVEQGWVEVVDADAAGHNVYRLTDAGRQRAAELLGIDPESIV